MAENTSHVISLLIQAICGTPLAFINPKPCTSDLWDLNRIKTVLKLKSKIDFKVITTYLVKLKPDTIFPGDI
ncbi:hypothetical protein CEXT_3331 [Caerostris extrusa]|uniref:Uncharacterized protein n=1 Tax=Caerostris extrusa TaxID=172846 RepID=A0AAV4Y4Y0_CAEEX|nr:hypothetical protein CEXT_3331 [Caerostris extrusa]